MGGSGSAASLTCELVDVRPGDVLALQGTLAEVEHRLFHRVPRRLGRYELHERLGSGGFGVVYAAHDTELDRRAAIKLVQPIRDQNDATRRLIREAQAMAQVNHPAAVKIFDVGVFDRTEGFVAWPPDLPRRGLYIVMELVPGGNLRQWLGARPRSLPEIRDMFVAAGEGLAAAHAEGILHRDFKPSNVLVDRQGRPKVVDFGLARVIQSSDLTRGTRAPDLCVRRIDISLTLEGSAVGTPAYMAPEQLLGKPTDERTDQYNFCVALYEAICGHRPFAAHSMKALADAKLANAVIPPREDLEIAPHLLDALLRGLRADPTERWPSMRALLDALQHKPRRRGVAALAVTVAGAAAVAGWLAASQAAPCDARAEEGAGSWSPEARAKLEGAFARTGSKHADRTAEVVARRLDAFSHEWSAVYRASCEAGRSGTTSADAVDRQMQCLRRQRETLAATTAVLADADETVVLRAMDVVADFPAPQDCFSASPDGVPPAENEAASMTIQADLRHGEALAKVGRAERGVPIVEAALARAWQLGSEALVAEALVTMGRLHTDLADYATAIEELEEAYFTAERAGDDATAAEAAGLLIYALCDGRADYAGAREWARHVEALSDRLGAHHGLEAQLANRLGYVAELEGRFGDALGHYRHQVDLLEARGDGDEFALAAAHRDAGRALGMLGERSAAVAELEGALAVAVEILGREHPGTAAFYDALSAILLDMGQYDRARTLAARSLSIVEATYGERHGDLAGRLSNLANVSARLGDLDEAIALYERALSLVTEQRSGDHPLAALILANLAQIHLIVGDVEQAELEYGRALDLTVASLGSDHPQAAANHTGLGRALQAQGRYADALAHHERALAIVRGRWGEDHAETARVLHDIGLTHLQRENGPEAIEYLTRAFELRQAADVDRLYLVESRAALAEAFLLGGADRAQGLEYARAAWAGLREVGAGADLLRPDLEKLLAANDPEFVAPS